MFNKKDDFGWFKFCPQTRSEVKIHAMGEPLDLILWQGKQWAVTEYGLEKRDGTYHVPAAEFYKNVDPLRFPKTKDLRQIAYLSWFHHLTEKNWVDELDIDHALQAMCLLFNTNGTRTSIQPPTLMGEAEIEEYAAQCANDAYEAARRRAMKGLVFNAP
jgi:hypothetical protein